MNPDFLKLLKEWGKVVFVIFLLVFSGNYYHSSYMSGFENGIHMGREIQTKEDEEKIKKEAAKMKQEYDSKIWKSKSRNKSLKEACGM